MRLADAINRLPSSTKTAIAAFSKRGEAGVLLQRRVACLTLLSHRPLFGMESARHFDREQRHLMASGEGGGPDDEEEAVSHEAHSTSWSMHACCFVERSGQHHRYIPM